MQVVQEYERAVIFRLGRLQPGGAKGPGLIITNIIIIIIIIIGIIIISIIINNIIIMNFMVFSIIQP